MGTWHEVTVRTAGEAVEMVSHYFHEHGAGGVVIEESGTLNRERDTSFGQWYDAPLNDIPEGQAVVQAYYAEASEARKVAEGVRALLDELAAYPIDTGPAQIDIRTVREDQWANSWKQYFKPVRITDRLVIKPTWEPLDAGPDDIVLELDPGMAFGTGTHATTALCLRALEKYMEPGMRVIDVGTGSGILAIAAAKLGAGRVLALDLDPVAVKSARDNIALGGLADRIDVRESDLLQVLRTHAADVPSSGHPSQDCSPPDFPLPADLIVANLLAEIVIGFVADAHEALADGGRFITSGIITRKSDAVQNALEQVGFRIVAVDTEEDWVAITAEKPG